MDKIKTFESFISERRGRRSSIWNKLRLSSKQKEKLQKHWDKAMDVMTGRKRRDSVLQMLTNDESAYHKFKRDPDLYVGNTDNPDEQEVLRMIDKYNIGFTDLMGISGDESDLRRTF
jgi:hypothetical protein